MKVDNRPHPGSTQRLRSGTVSNDKKSSFFRHQPVKLIDARGMIRCLLGISAHLIEDSPTPFALDDLAILMSLNINTQNVYYFVFRLSLFGYCDWIYFLKSNGLRQADEMV